VEKPRLCRFAERRGRGRVAPAGRPALASPKTVLFFRRVTAALQLLEKLRQNARGMRDRALASTAPRAGGGSRGGAGGGAHHAPSDVPSIDCRSNTVPSWRSIASCAACAPVSPSLLLVKGSADPLGALPPALQSLLLLLLLLLLPSPLLLLLLRLAGSAPWPGAPKLSNTSAARRRSRTCSLAACKFAALRLSARRLCRWQRERRGGERLWWECTTFVCAGGHCLGWAGSLLPRIARSLAPIGSVAEHALAQVHPPA
jgi:hypothetical protein